jgi:hypothetical protein
MRQAVAIVCGLDDDDVRRNTRLGEDLGLDWIDLEVILSRLEKRPSPIGVAEIASKIGVRPGEPATADTDAFSFLTVGSLADLVGDSRECGCHWQRATGRL